mmetsp:Transcript_19428/g.43173  ORF Transcript_19428/g.43173 Transcript_19428/m.43173 type:complete len:88 (+) Transcript_19428:717-980(+)
MNLNPYAKKAKTALGNQRSTKDCQLPSSGGCKSSSPSQAPRRTTSPESKKTKGDGNDKGAKELCVLPDIEMTEWPAVEQQHEDEVHE